MPPQLESGEILPRKSCITKANGVLDVGRELGRCGIAQRWFRSYITANDEDPISSMGVIRSSLWCPVL
jgi:hypothetical protein